MWQPNLLTKKKKSYVLSTVEGPVYFSANTKLLFALWIFYSLTKQFIFFFSFLCVPIKC